VVLPQTTMLYYDITRAPTSDDCRVATSHALEHTTMKWHEIPDNPKRLAIVQALRDGMGLKDIADSFQCSDRTIAKIRDAAGEPRRPCGPHPAPRVIASDDCVHTAQMGLCRFCKRRLPAEGAKPIGDVVTHVVVGLICPKCYAGFSAFDPMTSVGLACFLELMRYGDEHVRTLHAHPDDAYGDDFGPDGEQHRVTADGKTYYVDSNSKIIPV
jgi:hypothetical protein